MRRINIVGTSLKPVARRQQLVVKDYALCIMLVEDDML